MRTLWSFLFCGMTFRLTQPSLTSTRTPTGTPGQANDAVGSADPQNWSSVRLGHMTAIGSLVSSYILPKLPLSLEIAATCGRCGNEFGAINEWTDYQTACFQGFKVLHLKYHLKLPSLHLYVLLWLWSLMSFFSVLYWVRYHLEFLMVMLYSNVYSFLHELVITQEEGGYQ